MPVQKLVINSDSRLDAIRELRSITGMSLKEAVDLIPNSYENGDVITVNTITEVFNLRNFRIADKVKVDGLKRLVNLAIEVDEYEVAMKLLMTLQSRAFTNKNVIEW